MKTVTVVVPTYNRVSMIESTLLSVIRQEYESIEIIIVDDGSKDETDIFINNFIGKYACQGRRIIYLKQQNQGACVARNNGMAAATGTYIMFLDSDDLIKPGYLKKQVAAIESVNADCSICDFECIDKNGVVVETYRNDRHPHDFIRDLASPSISTVLIKSDSLLSGLEWNRQLKKIQDVDFFYKYFSTTKSHTYVNEPLFQYCLHEGERISDSYLKGIPYRILRQSFKLFIDNNRSHTVSNIDEIYKAYSRVLVRHQLKNAIVGCIPKIVRPVLKKILRLQ